MFTSLKQGYTLNNVVIWKKIQLTINVLVGWLPVAAVFYPQVQDLLDKDLIEKITTALAITNTYLTIVTTSKIGV